MNILRNYGGLTIVVSILAVVFFLPGLGGGFLLDDKPNIVTNASLHLTQINHIDDLLYAAYSFEPGGSSRPLAMLSFALDFWRAGLDPVAFKTTNLIIHGLTCLVLAFFFRQLLLLADWPAQRAAKVALLLALLWAVHPLQVSSVLYIVQRMQTLATFFVLLTLLAYVHMRRRQIEGEGGRLYGILVILCGILAFSSKEDAALLPLYLLAMELTVLQFRAAQPALARRLRWVYGAFVMLGVLVFFFAVVPYFWHWEAYPGRDFSSVERLLTQGRVLAMYLGQIMLPLPGSMPFVYDDLIVSRGLWRPVTTLPSLLLVVGLLVWAWRWRHRRPVFALGILLFFSGHFMTSNVIGLELAFEHRNHFPLVGIVLALGDLVAVTCLRWGPSGHMLTACLALLMIPVGASALARSYIWGDALRLAEYNLSVVPSSERAWTLLCTTHFELSKSQAENPHLDLAIATCQKGAEHLPDSAILMSNVVIYKAVKGTVTNDDWEEFLQRLQSVPMTVQNKGILWVTLRNAESKRLTNERAVLETIEIITRKSTLRAREYLRVAAYIFNDTHEPIQAFSYLQHAVELSSPDDPAIQKMLSELAALGRQDWVDRLLEERKLYMKRERMGNDE